MSEQVGGPTDAVGAVTLSDDWENAKENVRPLKDGRDPKALALALSSSARPTSESLAAKQQEFEAQIEACREGGGDVVAAWAAYAAWTQQAHPAAGARSPEVLSVLERATSALGSDPAFSNDLRHIKLWVSYAECSGRAQEIFKNMSSRGIGTKLAVFYESWATLNELAGSYRDAEHAFREGIKAGAEPLGRLKRHYKHFLGRMAALAKSGGLKKLQEQQQAAVSSENAHASSVHSQKHRSALGTIAGPPEPERHCTQAQGLASLPPSFDARKRAAGPSAQVFCDTVSAADLPALDAACPPEKRMRFAPLPTLAESKKENTQAPTQWAGITIPQAASAPAVAPAAAVTAAAAAAPASAKAGDEFAIFVDEEFKSVDREEEKEDDHKRFVDHIISVLDQNAPAAATEPRVPTDEHGQEEDDEEDKENPAPSESPRSCLPPEGAEVLSLLDGDRGAIPQSITPADADADAELADGEGAPAEPSPQKNMQHQGSPSDHADLLATINRSLSFDISAESQQLPEQPLSETERRVRSVREAMEACAGGWPEYCELHAELGPALAEGDFVDAGSGRAYLVQRVLPSADPNEQALMGLELPSCGAPSATLRSSRESSIAGGSAPRRAWLVVARGNGGACPWELHVSRALQQRLQADAWRVQRVVAHANYSDGAVVACEVGADDIQLSAVMAEYARRSRRVDDEALALWYAAEVLRGVSALHRSGATHGALSGDSLWLRWSADGQDAEGCGGAVVVGSPRPCSTLSASGPAAGEGVRADALGAARVLHGIVYGEELAQSAVETGEVSRPVPRRWQAQLWASLFAKLLGGCVDEALREASEALAKDPRKARSVRSLLSRQNILVNEAALLAE
eukprot:m51a1_g13883 putative BUB family protein kinase (862) ;mRNA; f:654775-657778